VNDGIITFWEWFRKGAGGKPGWRRMVNIWLIVHLFAGLLMSFLIEVPIGLVAKDALLPMLAVFIGLTFSWAGNAHSLMLSAEIKELAKNNAGGIYDYIYAFQLSILIMLFTIGLWTMALLQPKYILSSQIFLEYFNQCSTIILYASASLTLRTCWQAVVGTNMLLLVKSFLSDLVKPQD